MIRAHSPLRLRLDRDALVSNWRWLKDMSGPAACGAAIKANGYGVGAREVLLSLANAGCRDFFVATWAEAEHVLPLLGEASLSVFHGLAEEDVQHAVSSNARPVLNSVGQVRRWLEAGQGRPCDVMIDTGMNRLGLSPEEAVSGLLAELNIDTVMSHLASADEDVPLNQRQQSLFADVAAKLNARRRSLANSAGICLGAEYRFDLTRPGLALYGGIPRREAADNIKQVVRIEAQVVQRRRVRQGETVGYNGTLTALKDHEIAILNIGYADGYFRGFSGTGRARTDGGFAPVAGRVSMDLTAVNVDAAPHIAEGDWIEIDFDLVSASTQSGMSQYELLTSLGGRSARIWSQEP